MQAYLASWGPWFWLPVSILALGLVERVLQASQSWYVLHPCFWFVLMWCDGCLHLAICD